MLKAKNKVFNGFLDITDPGEFLGRELSNFSISLNYPISNELKDRLPVIQQGFYEKIVEKLDQESFGNTKYHVIDYQDSKVYNESPRKYLKIEYSTARSTQVTTLTRCLIHGDNLYIALDSYVLGGLKIKALIIQTVISFLSLYLATIFPPLSILVFVYLYFTWIDVFRATRQKPGLMYGLRCKFNKSLDLGLFNTDDTLMFLKSLLPIVTSTVREVFRSNGIPLEGIEDLLKNIEHKVSGQSVSIEAGGNISLFGVNIASYDSNASSS
ncbi:MAG: hypothetical protein QNJ37_13090 [Crocosphaera sp.]|nr:hypothetical protein [Crocosphaera sp.]